MRAEWGKLFKKIKSRGLGLLDVTMRADDCDLTPVGIED